MQRLEFAYWFLVLLWSSVSSLCSLSFLLEWASSNEGRNCIVRLPGEQGQAAELCVMRLKACVTTAQLTATLGMEESVYKPCV
ncbi:hypothetical protein LEMLEM_LOCUS11227 [Lemmus lemmus]